MPPYFGSIAVLNAPDLGLSVQLGSPNNKSSIQSLLIPSVRFPEFDSWVLKNTDFAGILLIFIID